MASYRRLAAAESPPSRRGHRDLQCSSGLLSSAVEAVILSAEAALASRSSLPPRCAWPCNSAVLAAAGRHYLVVNQS